MEYSRLNNKLIDNNHQKKVFNAFADLAREIERQTARQTHLIDAKIGRARYLVDQKKRLQKKLADVDAELDSMRGDIT
ncbi:hypothetical protein [Candidatus Nitrososphaera gargensis]|nr:hypothetical protein [Candidatus Nitrososphaera gargensis]